jgi:hypothetical protein
MTDTTGHDTPQTEATARTEAPARIEPAYKVERPKPRMTRKRKLGMGALLAGASLAALWTVLPTGRAIPAVETSAVEEFQDQEGGSAFGAIEPRPEAKSAGDSGFADIEGEFAAQSGESDARNAALQTEVDRLQKELRHLAKSADAGKDQTARDLALAQEKAQAQNLALIEGMRQEFDQQIAALSADSETRSTIDSAREADLAARRAEREAQLAARVASLALQPGDVVQAFLRPNPGFQPDRSQTPLILIGAGTGIGPLAGFLRANRGHRPMHLWFGARHPQADFLYAEELTHWQSDKRLTSLHTAFSRKGRRHYVQDALREDAEAIRRLMADGGRIMVCGGRDMAQGVRDAMTEILHPLGLSPAALRAGGRYAEDVY